MYPPSGFGATIVMYFKSHNTLSFINFVFTINTRLDLLVVLPLMVLLSFMVFHVSSRLFFILTGEYLNLVILLLSLFLFCFILVQVC